ncbi:hypothetical protein EVAR_589_1 [Eumeta japonica]|uniref:Uncharacterized protein n=1 Tax=Eumeta variegata TaxID=151549 RepID=A0A4C1SB08_EUMVA|nr:hypothetical protein EVAR_589_1 [Eumeta japonica]
MDVSEAREGSIPEREPEKRLRRSRKATEPTTGESEKLTSQKKCALDRSANERPKAKAAFIKGTARSQVYAREVEPKRSIRERGVLIFSKFLQNPYRGYSGGARRRRRRRPPTASRLKGPRKQKSFAYKLLKRGLANLMSPTSTSGVAPPLIRYPIVGFQVYL